MSLRARLLLSLLALALLPTLVFTLFTLDQLGRSAERWFRPGVHRALEEAVEVSKHGLIRMESTVLALADELASRVGRTGGPARDAERRTLAEGLLRASGTDVVQFYRRKTGGWTLTQQVVAPGILLPEPPDFSAEIASVLHSTRVIHDDRGALAGVSPLGEDEAVAAAMWAPPGYFAQLDSIGVALGYYRRLGVVVDVQRRSIWLLVALLVLGVAALALAVAHVLARAIARPLRDLAGALEQVAAGDLAVRVNPRGAREMRTLGTAFNAMTGRLADARDALREAERDAAWREVARRLAHEFKNILTPMSLSLHRLRRRTDAVAEDQRDVVRSGIGALDGGVEQLARLAQQFSEYARLPDPRFETLDLTDVARAAVELHEHEGIEVTLRAGSRLPVRGDSLLLSRAIHNLVLNACEASPRGGQVEVRTSAEGGNAVLEVLDQGPGVPPDLVGRVFEPYVSTKKRGSGLGLSLVRDIAIQHEGTVTIENRVDGALARLLLPLVAADGGEVTT